MIAPDRQAALGSWAHALADRIPGGIVTVTCDGVILLANPAAHQLLEAPTEEELQLAVEDLLHQLGDESRVELPASGTRRALVVERVTRDDAGPREDQMLVLQDAVGIEAADADLLLANRMRSVENLYRAMAHDLKSPLQAIVLNAELLREIAARADDDDRALMEEHLDVIQGEISRLGRSIQSLLSQTGPSTNTTRRVDLRRIQREIVTLITPVARRKQIRIRAKPTKKRVSVSGNRDRLKQALLNLAVNAIEAVDKGGRLEFELQVDGNTASFEIHDDGHGIPPELELKVFESHFTTKPNGSGIGLGVVQSIARAHRGNLQLIRRDPRGTTARLTLPLAGKKD